MANKVMCVVFIVSATFLPLILAGTVAVPHRDTTLDELKSIDSYVSSALPVLEDGFFIGTSSGPVLVKSAPLEGQATPKRPSVIPGYYNKLPRLIPAGFEGVAVSHFNLGAANPYQPIATSKSLLTAPVVAQPQQFVTNQPVYPPQQYIAQQTTYPTQHAYQAQQYVAETQQAAPEFGQYRNGEQQFIQNDPRQQQFIQNNEPQQLPSPQQYIQAEQPQQQFLGNEQPQPQFLQAQQPQHQFIGNGQPQAQFLQAEQPQQQFLGNDQPQPQLLQAEQSQQQYVQQEQPQQQRQFFPYPQQYVGPSSQLISEQPVDSQQAAQEPQQISARSQPVDEPSFQVDNLLRQEEPGSVTAFQTQVFGRERFQSQQLLRNPAVVATSDFEETLPETLRNRFYKNANLATILAQESLPVQGEQIIGEWDTNKIAKGKIHALLSGAGLI